MAEISGMKAIVDWEAKPKSRAKGYQAGAGLRPGDMVPVSFRPEFAEGLTAFTAAQKAAGFQVVLLEDYLATR